MWLSGPELPTRSRRPEDEVNTQRTIEAPGAATPGLPGQDRKDRVLASKPAWGVPGNHNSNLMKATVLKIRTNHRKINTLFDGENA